MLALSHTQRVERRQNEAIYIILECPTDNTYKKTSFNPPPPTSGQYTDVAYPVHEKLSKENAGLKDEILGQKC